MRLGSSEGESVTAFRALLIVLWVALAGYTTIVAANHGIGLLLVCSSATWLPWGWPGQFNSTSCSCWCCPGLWVAWRHQFSGAGLVLGLFALFGGSFFLTAYLLVVSVKARGEMKEILLG